MNEITKRYKLYLNEIVEKNKNNKDIPKEILDKMNKIIGEYIVEMMECISKGFRPLSNNFRDELLDLKVLWITLDDLGYEYAPNTFSKELKEDWRGHAKIRLFMMMLKTFDEIIYLLMGGYSSCALSRVRKLYEIGVYLEIIKNNTSEVAEKFLKFSNKNRIDLARVIGKKSIEKQAKKTLSKYGVDVFSPYGWMKGVIPIEEKITFKKIAMMTELSEHYSTYIMSSWSVHADVYGSDKVIILVLPIIINIVKNYFDDYTNRFFTLLLLNRIMSNINKNKTSN